MGTISPEHREDPTYTPPHPDGHRPGLWLPPGPDDRRTFDAGDPTLWILLTSAMVVLMLGSVRADIRYAGNPEWYWISKVEFPAEADVVIAGDSRTYRGIEPLPFRGIGKGRCMNFGFSSAHLTPPYLEHAASLLSADGARVLLVGVTPFSLRPPSPDGYTQACQGSEARILPIAALRVLESWESQLDPIAIDLAFARGENAARMRATSEEYRQRFHPDGWVESDRQVEDPVGFAEWSARKDFAGDQRPTAAEIDGLKRTLGRFVREGIRVIAFYPPVAPEIAAIEAELSGIDPDSVADALRETGVHFVHPRTGPLRTYDGSHLDGESARLFSKALATEVLRVLKIPGS